MLLASIHVYLTSWIPSLGPILLGVGLHVAARRESTDARALVIVLLLGSASILLDHSLPSSPGLPSSPLGLGGAVWMAIGLLDRAGKDAGRLVGCPAGLACVAAGYALPTVAALYPKLASIFFHPSAYALVLIAAIASNGTGPLRAGRRTGAGFAREGAA